MIHNDGGIIESHVQMSRLLKKMQVAQIDARVSSSCRKSCRVITMQSTTKIKERVIEFLFLLRDDLSPSSLIVSSDCLLVS